MSSLLENIDSPIDLKKLRPEELPALATELRQYIVEAVSRTGGHLAASLGVIELTIALHYVYNAPVDRIIWDVGHQSYAHKILTGRRKEFVGLRQHDGISGFPLRKESIYDCFGTGHAATSISAALGMAQARDLKNEDYQVVAIIGDGALTGGMAFEALNHAGAFEKKNLTIIVNDNEMSISPNVGALSSYLGRIITGTRYNRFKGEVETFLKSIPSVGPQMFRKIKKLEERIKGFFVPDVLFQELGFKYVGPIPGHNFNHLIETFKNVRQLRGPILIHVVTQKGRGYKPSEDDATAFHGVSPFIISSGKAKKKSSSPSYTSIFAQTMIKLAKSDKRIIGITAAMPQGTGLDKFAKVFPDRFYDVGIAEQHAVTFAAGLAVDGFRPVVAIYSTFLQRAYDQLIHDVCLQNLPVVFAIDRAGIVGEDGPTHHGNFDLSFLRAIPNLTIMAPRDENELQHMLKTALSLNSPVAIRYPRGSGENVKLETNLRTLSIGKGELLIEGTHISIFAIGSAVRFALKAAKLLKLKNINATVIDAKFVKPLDKLLLVKWAVKTGLVLTVEENVLAGGFGSAVMEMFETEAIENITLQRIGLPDEFIDRGNQEEVRDLYGLNVANIVKKAEHILLIQSKTHKINFSS